jgi:hypothetical protein
MPREYNRNGINFRSTAEQEARYLSGYELAKARKPALTLSAWVRDALEEKTRREERAPKAARSSG